MASKLVRSRWAALGAAVAVTLGAGGLSLSQAAEPTNGGPVYIALDTPCRVADTRASSTVGPKNTPIAAGAANAYTIQITGNSGNCTGIPAEATGVAINLTAINNTTQSHFRVYPADSALPGTANLVFGPGQTPLSNKVDVGLSPTGQIKIYNHAGTTNAAVDIFGYYIGHNHDDRYYTESEVDTALAGKDNVEGAVSGGNLAEAVAGAPEVLRTVTVQTPTSGYIIANASATLHGNGALSAAECSITTGTTVDNNALMTAYAASGQRQTLSGTRGFQENKAFIIGTSPSYTIRFVCQGVGGSPVLEDAQLNATFVPDPDAFGFIIIGP